MKHHLYYIRLLTEEEIIDELEDVEERTGDLETAVGDLNTAIGDLNDDIGDLNTDIGDLNAAIDDLENDITNLGQEVDDLQDSELNEQDVEDIIAQPENITATFSMSKDQVPQFLETNFDLLLAGNAATTRNCVRIFNNKVDLISQILDTNTTAQYTIGGAAVYYTESGGGLLTTTQTQHPVMVKSVINETIVASFETTGLTIPTGAIYWNNSTQLYTDRTSDGATIEIVQARQITATSDMNGNDWQIGDVGYILSNPT